MGGQPLADAQKPPRAPFGDRAAVGKCDQAIAGGTTTHTGDGIYRGTSIGRLAAVHAVGGKSAAARARGTSDAVLAHQQATVACPGNGAIPVAQGQDVVTPSEKQVFPGDRTRVGLGKSVYVGVGWGGR